MDQQVHRTFLNRYYGLSRHIYDTTRKYYLFGRDKIIQILLQEEWTTLIEIGSGTGRNLRKIQKKRQSASYGGLDASDEMLNHAKKRSTNIAFLQGFAEDAEYRNLLRAPPDRILFSYSLSMIANGRQAIEHALEQLAPGGHIYVVDFADLSGVPGGFRQALKRWLKAFHVTPLDITLFNGLNPHIEYGPLHYYVIIRLSKPS